METMKVLQEELKKSRAARLKFLGDAVRFLESQGVEVTDEVIRTKLLGGDLSKFDLIGPRAGWVLV